MKDKIAFVTGGTSGIGKEIVKELIEKGVKVITCYSTNVENAKTLESEIASDNLLIVKCDVSREDEVINIMNLIKDKFGRLDYLVNNAGTFIDNLIKEFAIDDFKKVLDINLLGKVICTKHAYQIMSDGGSIVNISSHLGVVPCTESPAYCAASAGIINFTKATALEYADKKIRANSICPAFTPTPLSLRGWKEEEIEQKLKDTPLGRFATPEDTAKLCLFLLSDDSSFITGENIWINGGRI
ncbi:MAG: SDR family oxidoreductase [Erysipelotrichales bacterium]|nr:SDR family oxidoreductase [Erysipelotrichales bacterium]